MADSSLYAVVGRAPDCDVVLDDPTVSQHHARLSWTGGTLRLEDLSSANGTFADGRRVKVARVRPGAEVRCGAVTLPWSHEGLRPLLKAGAGTRTLAMPQVSQRSYVCGSCGHLGALPSGPTPARLACGGCGATLRVQSSAPRRGAGGWIVGLLVILLSAGAVAFTYWRHQAPTIPSVQVLERAVEQTIQTAEAEQRIGGGTPEKLAKALTPLEPITRNAAARIAARTEGPFHVEQVAEIWSSVRHDWRYVNDPQGSEYFATASESIQNGYVGDCDDFSIVLTSMVIAIGGEARIIFMDSPAGGHAYAEACVRGEPAAIQRSLSRHYRTRWRRYLGGAIPRAISYRTSPDCPVWLNLDWNSLVPGGPYQAETWAVAIYRDGRSEPVAAAQGKATAPAPVPPAAPRAAPSPAGR